MRHAALIAILCASVLPANARAQEQPTATQPVAPAPAEPATPAEPTSAALAADGPQLEGVTVDPSGLTSDATAQRALAVSSDLRQKRAELETANAKISQTTIQFFPQLVLRGSYTRLSPVASRFAEGALVGASSAGPLSVGACPSGTGQCVLDSQGEQVGAAALDIETLDDNYALGASLTIPLSDYILRLSDAAASAQSSRKAARFALEAQRAQVETDARVLYYNFVRAHGQLFIAERAHERSHARLKDVQAAFSVGSATEADVMRIEALVANSQLAVDQAEALRQLTRAQLAIIMTDMGPADYRLGEGVPEPSADLPDAGGQALVLEAFANRLELKALAATIDALERGEDATRAGAYPRLDAVGDASYANPNQRFFPPRQEWNATWSVGVVASWNVGETFLSSARGDELAAQTESVRGQEERLRAAIANQVVSAALELRTARAALTTSETTVRATEAAHRVTADRFRVGRATTTDMVVAETDLLGAKQAQINARIDGAIAALRLRHALGRTTGRAPTR